MKFIKLFFVLILTVALLAGCSANIKNASGNKEKEKSKYKVGDILDVPEKIVSLDDIDAITIHEESEDKTYSSTLAMKRTKDYAVYFAQLNLTDGDIIKSVTYQIGDEYTSYQYIENQWYTLEDQPFLVLERFAYLGFDVSSHLSVRDGYTKMEDTVIDGKEYYTYKAFAIYDQESGDGEEIVIYVDKDTGIWMHNDTHTDDTVSKYHVTSVEYKYNNNILNICDPVIIPEQTIYNSNGVKVNVKKSVTADPQTAAALIFEVKNDTQSDIKITSHRLRVNGLFFGQELINGTVKANSTNEITVEIPSSIATVSDVYTIKNIDTRLRIANIHTETTPDGSYTVTDSVLVEDTGDLTIQSECSKDFEQSVDKNGTVVFNESNVKLTFKDIVKQDSGDIVFRFYAENNFSELIRIRIYINKINGIEFEDSYRFRMATDSEGFNGFILYADDISQFENIETVEIDYAVYYGDMDENSINYSDTITLLESSSPVTLTTK